MGEKWYRSYGVKVAMKVLGLEELVFLSCLHGVCVRGDNRWIQIG